MARGDTQGAPIWVLNLGRVPYDKVEVLQHRLVELRRAELIQDTLILLEHEPVITLGRRAEENNILCSADELAREGIIVRRIERGGDVTYHGPGQLVGYPIVHLPGRDLGASEYMHALEKTIMAVLASYGIATHRRQGVIGVWVGENKICALGTRIRGGVSFHGFALNVQTNMTHWAHIVACGIRDGGVTSMHLEMADVPSLDEVRERVAQEFGQQFDGELMPVSLAQPEFQEAISGIRPALSDRSSS